MIVTLLGFALLGLSAAVGFFERDPVQLIGHANAQHRPLAVLYVSGDLGRRFGAGNAITKALVARGLPVVVLNSPTAFATHKSRGQVDTIISGSVREALTRSNAERLILIGQSFGSDMLATGLTSMPQDLRSKIAGVILVVPGKSVFFRADPTGLSYRGTPDLTQAELMRGVGWTSVMCIFGATEADSLCPYLKGGNINRIALPGGHLLHRDYALVLRTIFKGLPAA